MNDKKMLDSAGRSSQQSKAVMGLRSLITSGALEPDTRLSEVALAARLGISRTPMRRAMDLLVGEGLLTRLENGGCRVASFSRQDVIDSIELRGTLEGVAARMAAERGIDVQRVAEGHAILDRIDQAILSDTLDYDLYREGNAEFHAFIAALPKSDIIEKEIKRVSSLPLASPSAFLQIDEAHLHFTRTLIRGQEQHKDIFDAILNREGARAEAVAREHARLARNNFDYFLEKQPSLARKIPGLALVAATPSSS